MKVLVTGGGGFLGRRLVRSLLSSARIVLNGEARDILEIVIADRAVAVFASTPQTRVRSLTGDLSDPAFAAKVCSERFDVIFHLAALLTLDAERDPAKAYATHIDPILLFAKSRYRPRLVFASSIAVFGGKLPDVVDESDRPLPQTTYGTHKLLVEHLLADASRHGSLDARALRLPILLVRPGAASPAISDKVAAIVRDPIAGRDTQCPLDPDVALPVASAAAAVDGLLKVCAVRAEQLPPGRALNLPALSVTPAEMIASLRRLQGDDVAKRVQFVLDPAIQAVIAGWPRRFQSAHAHDLSIQGDEDFDAIITDHLQDVQGREHATF